MKQRRKTKTDKKEELITFCRTRNGALFGSEQRRNHRMVRLWNWGEVEEVGGEQRTRKQERAERREKKRKGEGGGCRRQVLISNRLLVMRSLSHCSQIDVMWSSVVQKEACRGWQAWMTSLLTGLDTHKHTGIQYIQKHKDITHIKAGKCSKKWPKSGAKKHAYTQHTTTL